MAEKKTMSHIKHIPKDAQVIMSIMKDMGITDYEPKVINQLLEFTYRKNFSQFILTITHSTVSSLSSLAIFIFQNFTIFHVTF